MKKKHILSFTALLLMAAAVTSYGKKAGEKAHGLPSLPDRETQDTGVASHYLTNFFLFN